jgi:hypothetical protein
MSGRANPLLAEIVSFVREKKLAVQASTPHGGAPQSAVVGVVVSENIEIFFDTLSTSRKAQNLRRDGRISFVFGWDLEEAQTAQIEGVVDEPSGETLARLKKLYIGRFPDGAEREALPDITYFRARPTWIRWSDFRKVPALITEMTPIGSTWDAGRRVLETRLTGSATYDDVAAWSDGLARELVSIGDGTRFKLLFDLRGFDPPDVEVHKAMREVVPRLLARHGLRPALIDLFDDGPELAITRERGVECTGFANVHHDEAKMKDNEARIAKANQRFFTSRTTAEAWLDSLP